MHKLLSFKVLSKTPKQLPIPLFLQSNTCKTFRSLSHNNPYQFSNSSILQTYSISRLSADSFRSWRSQNISSQKISGIFKNPIFVNCTISNTHLRIHGGSFFDQGIRLMRAPFMRWRFGDGRSFDFSGNYRRSWIPTTNGIVLSLVIANVVVFLLWRTADPIFMLKNFTISLDNFTRGRVHTMVTSAFSHMEAGHLMSNMLGLCLGIRIGNLFGPKYLLKLYLAGAISGSIFFLVHNVFISSSSKDTKRIRGLGASGAVNAVMLLNIFLFPKAIYYVNFFIPVPAMLLGAFLIGTDLLRIVEGNSNISGATHLGGAVVAGLAWARIKRGRI